MIKHSGLKHVCHCQQQWNIIKNPISYREELTNEKRLIYCRRIAGPLVTKICQVSWFGCWWRNRDPLTHQMQDFFENIINALNLCSISLPKTKRHDASFVYDTQAGTWKETRLIWFGKERVMRGRVRRDVGRERELQKKEIDHWVGGNVSVLPAMHFPHVEAAICALFHTSV